MQYASQSGELTYVYDYCVRVWEAYSIHEDLLGVVLSAVVAGVMYSRKTCNLNWDIVNIYWRVGEELRRKKIRKIHFLNREYTNKVFKQKSERIFLVDDALRRFMMMLYDDCFCEFKKIAVLLSRNMSVNFKWGNQTCSVNNF